MNLHFVWVWGGSIFIQCKSNILDHNLVLFRQRECLFPPPTPSVVLGSSLSDTLCEISSLDFSVLFTFKHKSMAAGLEEYSCSTFLFSLSPSTPEINPRTSLGKCSTDVLYPQLSFHSILRVCLTELTRLALNWFCSPGRPWTWGPTASAYSVAVITHPCHQAQFTFPSLCISNSHHQWTHYVFNLLLTCYLYFLIECMS